LRALKILAVIVFFYKGSNLSAQTDGDSLKTNADTITLTSNVIDQNVDPLPYKPKYRRGIVYITKTNSGGIYTGFVVSENETELVLENRHSHEIANINQREIKSMTPLSIRDDLARIVGENHHARRYMFASSAFLFEPGKINSTYHLFILADADYAITENWAVSAQSIAFYPISIGVKSAFKLDENNYVGGGIFGFGNVSNSNNDDFFLGYGGIVKYTSGSSNRNFTIAGGVLALKSDVLFSSSPVNGAQFLNLFFSNLAYCSRLSERVVLNLEGWYFPEAALGIAGVGIKLVKREESCWTFGCYTFVNLESNTVTINFKVLPIPYIGLSQKF